MARQPGLLRRNGTWYARICVPLRLQAEYGKRQVWKSLRTSDRAVAERRCRELRVHWDGQFAAKDEHQYRARATRPIMQAAVRRCFHEEEERRIATFHAPRSAEEAEELVHEVRLERGLILQFASLEDASIQAALRKAMEQTGYRLDHTGHDYWYGARLVLRAFLEHAERAERRCRGDFAERGLDPFFNGAVTGTCFEETKAAGGTLAELSSEFLNDPNKARSRKTLLSYAATFDILRELFGRHKRVSEIGRVDCKRFREFVVSLPPNARKRFRSFKEAAGRAKSQNLARLNSKTVNTHLTNLGTFLGWAEKEDYIEKSSARNLLIKAAKKSRRQPFSMPELQQLLSGPVHRNREEGPMFWLPLLGLFTGARLNELASLDVEDVGEEHGISFLRIADGPDRSLKTKSAARFVPIHSELLRIGFREYVEARRAAGSAKLFALDAAADGYRSSMFSKRFARYMKELGLKRPELVFHSFRHNFRDALREAGVSLEVSRCLCGWSNRSSGAEGLYGEGMSIRKLYEELETIKYPGLKLDSLYSTKGT